MRRAPLLVVLLVAAAGCRTLAPSLPLAADDPRPAALIRGWQELTAGWQALRGSARLAVDGEALHVRSRQILVVERPARLRVEVQGLLSQTLAVLVTDGPRYQLFRAEDRSLEAGEVQAGLLARVAGLDLTPEEAIDLVLGGRGLDPALAPLRGFATPAGEIAVLLVDTVGRGRERRVFDPQGRLRRIERLAGDGEVAWSAGFDEYAAVGGVELAHAIRVEVAEPETSAELRLSGVELNPVLPADIFQLRPVGQSGRREGEGG